MKTALAAAWAGLPYATAAHDGHGLTGAHWHATDAWGLLALAVAAGAAFWWRRK